MADTYRETYIYTSYYYYYYWSLSVCVYSRLVVVVVHISRRGTTPKTQPTEKKIKNKTKQKTRSINKLESEDLTFIIAYN
jgi:hypothetical protein